MDYYKDIIIIKKGKCFSKLNENSIVAGNTKKPLISRLFSFLSIPSQLDLIRQPYLPKF